MKQNFTVLVGDANGADKALQRYLAERGYERVIVYCMDVCRNNVGNWPTHAHTAESCVRHDRQYYGIKDLAMAKDASCGFMIWDGASKGTVINVMNLVKAEKKVLLYSAPKKHFFTVRTSGDLNHALSASGIKNVDAFLASLGTKSEESGHLHFAFHS
ncbi:MAG: hypothetical protein WCC98_17080 [Candidatus Acidiferrales bacterium]